MPYATTADLFKAVNEEKLSALVDDEGDGSQVTARLEDALTSASDEMDSYIQKQYSLPFDAPVPPVLRKIACDVAVYAIYAHSYDEVPTTRRDRYKDAVGMLTQIADGDLSLVESDGEEPTESTGRVGWYAV